MLVIVADDYGYAAPYDDGILEAVRAQAVDAVGVMVLRGPDAATLGAACATAEVEIGLHLEDSASPAEQLVSFERLFAGPPGYLDGHKHCHADEALAGEVARLAGRLGVPVRGVDDDHRELLRGLGVPMADRLVGRIAEEERPVPSEIEAALAGEPPPGVTEWMVHPGRAGGPSSYDEGRERDLAELLRLGDRSSWRARGVLRLPPSRAASA